MKIQIKILMASLLSLITLTTFADGCSVQGAQNGTTSYEGKTDCANTTLPSLLVNGKFTATKTTINGAAKINGPVHANFFTVNGPLSINGETFVDTLIVTGATKINGKITLSSSKLHVTTANGKLIATNSTFGDTTVDGSVNIQDSKINGKLTLNSNYSTLNGTVVNNIVFTNEAPDKPQILCLEKASHVKGDIKFASGKGMIYKIGASKIDGHISGAKVIQDTCPDTGDVHSNA
jgi:cytoskeletal protein CcmA (bactofilin family)